MDETQLELKHRTLQVYKDNLAWAELQIAEHGGEGSASLGVINDRREALEQIGKIEQELEEGGYNGHNYPRPNPTYTRDALIDLRVELARFRGEARGQFDLILDLLREHDGRLGRIEGHLADWKFNNK